MSRILITDSLDSYVNILKGMNGNCISDCELSRRISRTDFQDR